MCCSSITHCVFLLLLATGIHSQTKKCPDPQEILPCTCTEWGYPATDFNCSTVANNDELANVFNREFDATDFGRLEILMNKDLKTIRAGDLGNASFIEIWVTTGVLERVDPLAFAGSYSTATKIMLFSNDLASFPYEELPKFTSLESIGLDYNEIYAFPDDFQSDSLLFIGFQGDQLGSLRADALQGLKNINEVDFWNCNLSEILPGTFMGHPNLQYVSLTYNNLPRLSAGTFELHGDYPSLHVAYNRIETIEANAFSGVEQKVDVSFNKLTVLPEDVWRPTAEAGAILDVRGNPFVCGCDMAWLVLNSTLLAQVIPETTCEDGTLFIDLDPTPFEEC